MTAATAPAARFDWLRFLERYGSAIVLVALALFFASQNERFLSARNLSNILAEVSIYGVIAVGMTFVILTRGVDLAVGSLVGFSGIVAAIAANALGDGHWAGWIVALAVACAVGGAVGLVHGKAVTWLAVPPFIVTLGGLTVWRGATLLVNDGAPVSGLSESYRWWGSGQVFGVPVPVLVFAVVALAGYVVLRHTRYGRHVYAVGGNPEAARLAGLNVKAVVSSVYVLVGLLSGLAGFLLSARLGSAEAVAGSGYELRVIASVVIGGASLFGGMGGIGGTVIGALLIGVLTNGLVVMNVSAYLQQIVIGVIIVSAVAFDTFAKSRRGVIAG
ncbi:ABC transporter permease [Brevundimonas sp. Root1279]|uniref:ABC transporter permease n=1 Tax=Brevundimonas sp. Root1279 TaxID=1736443 RepID=UPI0006FCF025|nr:ABC transporter permease [Brevundimonas sp. Root1279]KQW82385.1 sugar ABC transporter permease [Brevundimonas sp. Root1279]